MAILNVRKLPDEVHRRLRVRAARAGHSMEAEARAIMTAAVAAPEAEAGGLQALKAVVDRYYGKKKPAGVVDELLQERRREAAKE